MQLCICLKKGIIITNSKVVFYMHLQLIKNNILSVVICYT
ncbi:entericidin B [Escherichia albertii]|nr:entericidin B [Escherichia albertii]EFO0998906.1 entericidin B [Escherichia albertii]EFO1268246.1 entericidin B [Escherichia albertii]EFO4717566.1 entericidin B [Escherichia albertii]PFF95856.1 entericidin B [Escherichia albertii]